MLSGAQEGLDWCRKGMGGFEEDKEGLRGGSKCWFGTVCHVLSAEC